VHINAGTLTRTQCVGLHRYISAVALLTITLLTLPDALAQDHRPNLIALWTLDDISTSSTEVSDRSGQQQTLDIVQWGSLTLEDDQSPIPVKILDDPNAASDRHGAVRGLNLAGDALSDDQILETDFTSTQMSMVTEMTLSIWVRPVDNDKGYLISLQNSAGEWIGLQIYNNERVRFYSEGGGLNRIPGFSTTSVVASPKFNHIERDNDITQGWMQISAVIKADEYLRFYLNAELLGEVPVSGIDLTAIRTLRVGQTFESTPTRALQGQFDQVRVYTTALSGDELLADYIEDSTRGPWAFEVTPPQDASGHTEGDAAVDLVTLYLDDLIPANGMPFNIADETPPSGEAGVMTHGVANQQVIADALNDARNNSAYDGKIVKILFPENGEFYVGDNRNLYGNTINVAGQTDLIIDGNGSKLIHAARRDMFWLEKDSAGLGNERVEIRNFTLDFFNEVYPFQTKVNVEKLGNYELELTPVAGSARDYRDYIDEMGAMVTWAAPDTSYSLSAVGQYSGTGSSLLLPFANLHPLASGTDSIVGPHEESNIGSYTVQVQANGSAVIDLSADTEFYDAVDPDLHYLVAHYGGKRAFSLQHSKHVTLQNIHVTSSPGNALAAFGGVQYLKAKNFKATLDPNETDPNAVVATKADGIFLFHNRGHYLFKNVEAVGGTEDRMVIRELTGFNPKYVDTHTLSVCYASNPRPVDLAKVGDIYELRDRDMNFLWRGTMVGKEVVDSKHPDWSTYGTVNYSNGSTTARACALLEFSTPVPTNTPSVYRHDTMVHHFNPDGSRFSSNYVIIGSTFGENRGNGAKFSAPHALIAHNTFFNTSHQGVKFPLMIDVKACSNSWGNNGSGARNVIFDNNVIANTGQWIPITSLTTMPPAAVSIFTNRYTPQNRYSLFCGRENISAGDNPLDIQWQSHFIISNNTVEDANWGGISVQSARDVLVRNNALARTNTLSSTASGPAEYGGAGAIQFTHSRQVIGWDNDTDQIEPGFPDLYRQTGSDRHLVDWMNETYHPVIP